MSISAVTLVLNDLERMGLVIAAGEARSTGGRRPTLYSINRKDQFVIGVDVGVRSIRAGRISLVGGIEDLRMRNLAGDRPAEVAAAVKELVTELVSGSAAGIAGVLGVGLSQPGLVDSDGKRVILDVNRGWHDVPFGPMLQDLLGFPVFLVEDARARILAEMEYGCGKGENHVLYVLIGPAHGKGISAGFESNGVLLDGAQGFAGEVGHMVMDPSGPICSCGRRGCWEALGDALHLVGSVGPLLGGTASAAMPLRVVAGTAPDAAFGTAPDAASGGDDGPILRLRDALERGDVAAEAAFGRFTEVHAEGIANLVHAFNPRLVVIGGKAAALGDRFLSRLVAALDERVMKPFRDGLQVRLSSIEEESPIRGAGAAVLRRAIGIRSAHIG